LIIDRVRDLGATALSITHDMASARKIADRIAMLHQGRIIWDGPVDRIDSSGDPMSISSSTARQKGRSAWRSGRCREMRKFIRR